MTHYGLIKSQLQRCQHSCSDRDDGVCLAGLQLLILQPPVLIKLYKCDMFYKCRQQHLEWNETTNTYEHRATMKRSLLIQNRKDVRFFIIKFLRLNYC